MGFNSAFKGLKYYQNKVVSVKHNLIYSLITIRLATCFDPTGSSSGLLFEPINVRKLLTFLGSQQMFTKINVKGSCPMTYNILKIL